MDLLITIDARAARAAVLPGAPGVLPPDSMIIHPGESFYGVPYDAWRQHVGDTMVIREMQDRFISAPPRRKPSSWNGARGYGVMCLLYMIYQAKESAADPPVGIAEISFAALVPVSIVYLLVDPILELPVPRWASRSLLALMLVLVFLATWLGARAV